MERPRKWRICRRFGVGWQEAPMADQVVVRRWLIDLGRLTAARSSHDEAADFIDTSTPMLAMRFPNEAFNSVSLEAVAAECKYLPAYGELVPLLSAWWRQHRPQHPALEPPPTPARTPPTEDELAYVQARVAEMIAALRSSMQPADDRRPAANYLSQEQLDHAYWSANVAPPKRPAP
jgi:hypothetical protein